MRKREKAYKYMGNIYRNKVEIEKSRVREWERKKGKGVGGVRNSETER